jgi:hypothetical protein
MLSDLKRIIEQISRDKGIEKHLLVETIAEAAGIWKSNTMMNSAK